MKTYKHPDSYVRFDELKSGTPYRPYKPTYAFQDYINENHAYYETLPVEGHEIQAEIEGSLRKEDALKLYEMAYFAEGDILELGTDLGLSSYIMSVANHDSGLKKDITTIDINGSDVERAQENLVRTGYEKRVSVLRADAVTFLDELIEKKKTFSFIFVDHSHEYDYVIDAAKKMKLLVKGGGFCLYHDFNDRRNAVEENASYGVYQAVLEGTGKEFQFYGVYGCTGLFKRKRTPKSVISKLLRIG